MFNISAHIWLYSLPSNTFLQYIVWTSFPLILITFSVGFTYLVSPHAIGKSLSSLTCMFGDAIRVQFVIEQTALSLLQLHALVCADKCTPTRGWPVSWLVLFSVSQLVGWLISNKRLAGWSVSIV